MKRKIIDIGNIRIVVPGDDEKRENILYSSKEFDYKIFTDFPVFPLLDFILYTKLNSGEQIIGQKINLYKRETYPAEYILEPILKSYLEYHLLVNNFELFKQEKPSETLYVSYGFRNRRTIEYELMDEALNVKKNGMSSIYFTWMDWNSADDLKLFSDEMRKAIGTEPSDTPVEPVENPLESLKKEFLIEDQKKGYTLSRKEREKIFMRYKGRNFEIHCPLSQYLWSNNYAQKSKYNVLVNFPHKEILLYAEEEDKMEKFYQKNPGLRPKS